MIFGQIGDWEESSFLEDPIKECFAYLKSHDVASYENGSHGIDGDRLFVNVMEYTTTTPKNRFWEAHREYLDVHVVLSGQERVDVNFIQNMQQKEYVRQEDFLPMEGEKNGSILLRPGEFLVCYPSDGHRTAIAVEGPEAVKKAIFKVRIKAK